MNECLLFCMPIPMILQDALPYGAQARKPALRYNSRKVNNNYLMLRLVLVYELVPDKAP